MDRDNKAATTATKRTTRTQAAKPTSKAAKPVAVYALTDPRTGDVRYIGKAAQRFIAESSARRAGELQ